MGLEGLKQRFRDLHADQPALGGPAARSQEPKSIQELDNLFGLHGPALLQVSLREILQRPHLCSSFNALMSSRSCGLPLAFFMAMRSGTARIGNILFRVKD